MLQVGKYFGSYKVIRLLGKGGMGSVYQLLNNRGQFAAAKILDPEAATDPESRARFLREAQIAYKIDTPSVIKTFDIGEDPATGLCYILMEYVGGGSLHDLIRSRGTLTVEEALEYTRKVAEVLEEVRVYGVVHRDIKPDNIMFTNDGQIKLADLGIARSVSAKVTTITKSGVVMGTPAYMAPEQMIDSHSVDTRSDIYSLGIVLFEMLVGRRPYHDATFMELMAKVVQGEKIPDVRTFKADIPAAVSRLIAKMCHNNLARRFSTPGEVVAAIEKIQGKKKQPKISFKKIFFKLKRNYNPFYNLLVGVVVAIVGCPIVFHSLMSSIEESGEATKPSAVEEKPSQAVENNIVPILNAVGSDAPEYTAKNGQKIYSATFDGYKWFYRLDNKGEAALCNYKQDSNDKIAAVEPNPTGEITVPALLNGHKLVRLAGGAFRNVEATKIVLPEGLKEIGSGAFNDCHNLKEMRFPDSVERVEANELFRRCDVIEEIDLNRAHGFGYHSIFWSGKKLKRIKIDEKYSDLKYVNHCILNSTGKELYFAEPTDNEKIVVPEGVEVISSFAFAGCAGKKYEIKLPKSLNRLSDAALSWVNADVLIFHDGFETVGQYAFWQSSIKSVAFPSTGKNFNIQCFLMASVDQFVFRGKVPKNFTSVLKDLNRNKTKIFGPMDVAGWAEFSEYPINLYQEKDLESIIAGKDPEDKYLAYTNSWNEKVYCAEVKGFKYYYVLNQYGEAVLHRPDKDNPNERLTAVEPNMEINYVIPSSLNGHVLVRLERDSLHDLKARHIEIPDTVRELGMGVFVRCRNLEEIRFPPSLRTIETYWLFAWCNKLKTLDLNNVKGFTAFAINGTPGKNTLEIKINEAESDLMYMGNCLVRKEDKKLIWVDPKGFKSNELIIPEGVRGIDTYAIGSRADGLNKVVLPSTLVELNEQSFLSKAKRVVFLGNAPGKLVGAPFKNVDPQKTEIVVNKDAKGWNDSRDFGDVKLTFGDFAKVVEWKALNTYPQALRRAVSRIKAKTKKDDTANVFVGQLSGYDGDYRNVYSRAQISKSGIFFVAGEPGDTVEFSLKGYKKHVVVLPKATVPQSGMIPVLGDSNLKKEGSK